MARMHFVTTDDGRHLLQGTGDHGPIADFSLFDLDGEGVDPFSLGNGRTWEIADDVLPQDYDPDDQDDFFEAVIDVVGYARAKGYEIPEYAVEALGLDVVES